MITWRNNMFDCPSRNNMFDCPSIRPSICLSIFLVIPPILVNISETPRMDFFKFVTNVQLDPLLNCSDFGHHRSKFNAFVTSQNILKQTVLFKRFTTTNNFTWTMTKIHIFLINVVKILNVQKSKRVSVSVWHILSIIQCYFSHIWYLVTGLNNTCPGQVNYLFQQIKIMCSLSIYLFVICPLAVHDALDR